MKYDGKNLNEVLEAHGRWLSSSEPEENDRADLSRAVLSGSFLFRADLARADLREATLRGANLSLADLSVADLYRADMRGVDLFMANLRKADLRGANLRGADMREANLCGANLCEADLTRADLSGADLREARNIPMIPMTCPDTGSFIGWKKCSKDLIVKLQIPEDAKRCSATGRKCRCDKAIVLEIQNIDGTKADVDTAFSTHENATHFAYKIGETVVPEQPFDENRWNECASGIHFFINRQEAVNYVPY